MKRPVGGRAASRSATRASPTEPASVSMCAASESSASESASRPADDLDDHEAEDQPEREPQLAAVGVGRDAVVVAVVMGHRDRFTACPPPPNAAGS